MQPVDTADLGAGQWSQDLQELDALCQDIETDRIICSELFVNIRYLSTQEKLVQ